MNNDGVLEEGELELHDDCPARIVVYYRDGLDDPRALIIPRGQHNHPPFPALKVPIKARVAYQDAAYKLSLHSNNALTVRRLAQGMHALSILSPDLIVLLQTRECCRNTTEASKTLLPACLTGVSLIIYLEKSRVRSILVVLTWRVSALQSRIHCLMRL
jgi:hypothetical protein